MKAIFARKLMNMEELREVTESAKKEGSVGTEYTVIREVGLSDLEFEKLGQDLLEDQPWIKESDGGNDKDGKIRCIRVQNLATNERILINSEGYDYPRYTAIEN
ncbi:MAG: hypothetical protein PWP56_1691 [Acetobacterium sp.]|jgi:hypothetical protein|uniref:hypothetical protein n=1 Tax=Acetobacterium sp. K1/6 TaxID=3055467 RepID=UPI0029E2FF25|nr:hypothetical protein [Acetobacterium sp. K1/6]MDK2942178.1 hypothetical protein [Acetobacterium sp.]MDZ5723457.1 hypothetical protein [Acetobacterium sp. K1/6]